MGKEELYRVIEKLPDMDSVELKETLVGIANTRFGEEVKTLVGTM